MSVKGRLIEFIKFKGISIRQFCKEVGLSSGYVTSMRNSLQPDKLHKIMVKFPDLNPTWLMCGEGEMLRAGENVIMHPIDRDKLIELGADIFKDKLIEMFKRGEIYSSTVVQEQNALIQSLYLKISRLEEENQTLKSRLDSHQ